jgi:hypothetical protein
MFLVVDVHLDAVLFRKAVHQTFSVFIGATNDVIGDTDI